MTARTQDLRLRMIEMIQMDVMHDFAVLDEDDGRRPL